MSSNESQEQKAPSSRTMQYTSSQYDELFKSVINSKKSPALRKSPRISSISSPTQASSPQHTAEEPQECASLENSQTTRSQNSPKAITKMSKICSEASKKLTDYLNNQTDSISTLQSEEFRNNAVFSSPVEKNIKSKIVPKSLKKSSTPKTVKKKHKSFRNALNSLNTSFLNGTNISQTSSSFSLQDMIPLSQPPKKLSHREKMLWLRERRGTGLYAACDNCNKWRFLETSDPLDLPEKWFCEMNPDPKFNRCTIPEETIPLFVDDDLIHNKYTAGSLVWARYLNYPWWPAIVEDDPDTEQYYWLEYMSDIPTYYHVMFFDAPNQPVTRAWVTPSRIKPFLQNLNIKNTKSAIRFGNRILQAKQIAQNASKLNIKERLLKYGFLTYSNVEIHTPIQTPETSDDEGDGPTTQKLIRKSMPSKKNNPKRSNPIVYEDNDYVINQMKKGFEDKETHHLDIKNRKRSNVQENAGKVSKLAATKQTLHKRYTLSVESFDKEEQCVTNSENRKSTNIQVRTEKIIKPRKSVIKSIDTKRNTTSEMTLKDDDTDTEYKEWFETRQKLGKISKSRKSISKSPKINIKRRYTISEHSFENEGQNNTNKKFPGQLVTDENNKKKHNTSVDQSSSFTRLEKSGTRKISQLALEKTPTITQKKSSSSVDIKKKSYSKVKRRNTIANDNGNMNDVFEKLFPDKPKTDLDFTCLNKSLEGAFVVNARSVRDEIDGEKSATIQKRINSSLENCRFSKTHITAKNSKSTEIISFKKSDSNFENEIKLFCNKESFDKDSNDAFQVTDKKKTLFERNESKKETPKKGKKSPANKGFIRPLRRVDNSFNSLNSETTINSFSLTNFNSGKEVKTTDLYMNTSMTSFDLSSASQNETKAKKRLGYSRKK